MMSKNFRARACTVAGLVAVVSNVACAQSAAPAVAPATPSITSETVARALAATRAATAPGAVPLAQGAGEAQRVFVPAPPAGGSSTAGRRHLSIENGPRRTLVVGEVSTIELPSVARVAIGNGTLIKASVVDDRQIVLIADAAGETTMRVWLKDGRQISYDITVRAYRGDMLLDQIRTLVSDMPGVRVSLVGDRIVLDGHYPNLESVERVKSIVLAFPAVLNLIPEQPAEHELVKLDPIIQLDLRVIEVKKTALDQVGVNWSATANGPTFMTNMLGYSNTPYRPSDNVGFPPVTTGHPISTYFGLATQLTSALNLLEQNGDAWTIAEPHLSCKSGGASRFLAGGEIPIPVSQGLGAVSVVYKAYGVVIEFKPVSDRSGNVDSQITVEVSQPDPRNSNQGFVAFTSNRAETQVALRENEPLVIAGLLQQQVDRSSNGLPGLSRLPLIGTTLFGAKDNRHDKTELIVIVTPHIVGSAEAGNRAAVDHANEASIDITRRNDERLSGNRP
jgi:pilus assembly protein CpaC